VAKQSVASLLLSYPVIKSLLRKPNTLACMTVNWTTGLQSIVIHVLRPVLSSALSPWVVFSREEFVHPAGLLCTPQRLPAVWIRRLDSGEDGASRAAQNPQTETRGPRQPGRGSQKTAHTQTLQLKGIKTRWRLAQMQITSYKYKYK